MVEIPRLEAKRGFVMPAQAGIHLRARRKAKINLDSGLRRNDYKELSISSQRIQTLGFKSRVIQFYRSPATPNAVCAPIQPETYSDNADRLSRWRKSRRETNRAYGSYQRYASAR